MTDFPLAATGDINARIIQCSGGGWTWESLGGGFRGRRSGGDDAGNSGSGGGDNPTTGADGAHAETTGEESQEIALGLSQNLMLEGESFQATLTLNSIVAQSVENINVTLLISDASGADAQAHFTIVPASPTDLGTLPGGGQVIGDWLIVPTVEVTRSEGEDFRIRAQLDYDYEGQAYRFTTIEETITVFPAPELIIDYELPEANLVCTTFDLKATFHNVGAGPARNLRLTGGQPRVTRNTGNTPQSFKVTRVAVNGVEAANVTMALDIGDIPPGGFGEVVWRIEAEEAGRFVDFSSDYRMLNYLGEALAPSLRGINTTFATPSDPFEYGCLTDAFSVSGYVRNENDTPIPGITVASDSGRTAVTNADGYYILPGLVTGTYTIVPTRTGYTFLPETGAASVPPNVTGLDFTGSSDLVTVEVFDAQGTPVTALGTDDEGWPTPNPLTVTVTLTCPADGADCDYPFSMTLDSDDNNARFYVYDKNLNSDGINVVCLAGHSNATHSYIFYQADCTGEGEETTLTLSPGETKTMYWAVWIQPSRAATLDVSAVWSGYNGGGTVSIEQAQIHPIFFLPGLGATLPPTYIQSERTLALSDLITKYSNLFVTLEKMGYEKEKTLFIYNYNWLYSVISATEHLKNERLIPDAQTAATVDWVKKYDNDKVKFDIVTHSTGGLIARAYIQTEFWNDEVQVHRLATVAAPHRGVMKSYSGWEGLEPDLGPQMDWGLRHVFIPPLAYKAGYARRICIKPPLLPITCHIYMTEEEEYAFTHDPIYGMTILPEFLPEQRDAGPGGIPYLRQAIGGFDVPYPYDRQANPLWEAESVVTGPCNPDPPTGFIETCDPYKMDHPEFETVYYGLNRPDKTKLIAQRIGMDNLSIIYGDGFSDMPLGFRVTMPSDTAPYWRNGKRVSDIPGIGDSTVPLLSANPEDIWSDVNGTILTDVDYNPATGVFDNPNDGKPSIFNVQTIHKTRVDPPNQGALVHASIVGYSETQDAVIRALTRLKIPPTLISEFGPEAAEAAAEAFANVSREQLLITVLSPVELMLTDIQGRRLGYNSTTGEDVVEIPYGVYLRDEETGHKSLFIPSPEAGEITLTLTGVDTGEYTLLGHYSDELATVNLFALTGTTTLSHTEILTVTVPDASTEIPTPPDVLAGPDILAYKGQSLAFTGVFSDINADESHTIAWDFGDGETAADTLTPTHTFGDAGLFTVTLTVTDSFGFVVSDSLQVKAAPVFHEVGGQVVMEAERFAHYSIRSRRIWFTQTALTGYTGTAYVSALPDTDRLFTTPYTTASPELQYGINFTTTGVYYVWLRGYAPNGAGDSVYLGLKSQNTMTTAAVTGFAPRRWQWANRDVQYGTAAIEIAEPGVYTFYLWQREDGLRLDRILLTTDSGYNPIGHGPPESEIE